jgi:hypothetical protein
VRRVLEFLGSRRGSGFVEEHLDEVDVGEATFTELPDDPVAILIDPNVFAAVGGVVESVQTRE